MAEVSGAYDDPISPKEAEVMALLEADAGPEAAIRLRAESEALTPEMAIRLAESEG
jgi:plasmid maintenance system antidote protein VapI